MTRRRKLAASLSILALGAALGIFAQRAFADGIPTENALTYTGYLEDPNGVPIEDKVNVNVAVYASADGDEKECEKSVTDVTPVKGRFQIELPDTCVDAIKATPDLWVEATVGGTPLGRTKIGAVPYAIEADRAATTTSVASNFEIITAEITSSTTAKSPLIYEANTPCPSGFDLIATSIANVQLTASGDNGWANGTYACTEQSGQLRANLSNFDLTGKATHRLSCMGICVK